MLLYFLLSRWALPQVGSVLVERRTRDQRPTSTRHGASKMQADAAVAELTEATRRARAESQTAIATATQQAKAEAAANAAVMNEKLDAQLHEAETRIAAARTAAMGALRQVAGETATAVVTRLTGHAPEPDAVDRAVGGLLPSAAH